MTSSVLKWHGGKSKLASRLVDISPENIICRVEPYAGALWYTLASDPTDVSEVVNDLSYHLTNFWWCLNDDKSYSKLVRYLETTPFSEHHFYDAKTKLFAESCIAPDHVAAARFFVHCRQSRAGDFKNFTPLTKNRLRRGMNEQVSAWWTAIEGLEPVYHRMRRILVLNRPALDVIITLDSPSTHFYLDPPYMHDLRIIKDAYAFEMSEKEHIALLETIIKVKGTVMISGKRCPLYDKYLKDWYLFEFDVPLDSAGGKSKRRTVECVWLNYDPKERCKIKDHISRKIIL